MTTGEFSSGALDEYGNPRWISELAVEDPNHLIHLVREITPAEAVAMVGGEIVRWLRPHELPAARPDSWTTLGHVAAGLESGFDILIAGQRGDWTFVYDTGGVSGFTADRMSMAGAISMGGRVAVTAGCTINWDLYLEYAVNGEVLYVQDGNYDPEIHDESVPDALRPAIVAAGVLEKTPEARLSDSGETMRIACLLAGLTWTPDEFRSQPLIVGNVVSAPSYKITRAEWPVLDQPRLITDTR